MKKNSINNNLNTYIMIEKKNKKKDTLDGTKEDKKKDKSDVPKEDRKKDRLDVPKEDKKKDKEDKKTIRFKDKYKLLYPIGKGSFGTVCLSISSKNNKYYAAKIEERGKRSRIKEEYNFYKELKTNKKNFAIPKMYDFLQTNEWNIIIMELLGDSLDQLFIKNKKQFDVGTVLKLGIEITTILEEIHNADIIHRDIKPNNFMIGHPENKRSDKLYIIDFGLSKKYINNGNHISLKTDRTITGTARYVSTNIHMGMEPSRRDDLESVGYMLVFFLKGTLPWQGLKIKDKEKQIEMIGNIKLQTSYSKLCEGLLPSFEKYLTYCRDQLEFTTKPDYQYLRNLFIKDAADNNIELKYWWTENLQ